MSTFSTTTTSSCLVPYWNSLTLIYFSNGRIAFLEGAPKHDDYKKGDEAFIGNNLRAKMGNPKGYLE